MTWPDRDWFARGTVRVARDLVGCALVVNGDAKGRIVARIVETEAYLGTRDPASHAARGITPRCAVMFGEPGHLYVYFTYGMHHCVNVVTEPAGVAGAVLLRAAAVEEGQQVAGDRRGAGIAPHRIASGPGNLARSLGVTLGDNHLDLLDPASRLRIGMRSGRPPIAVGTRIGVSAGADRPLRFAWRGHPAVSRPVPTATPS